MPRSMFRKQSECRLWSCPVDPFLTTCAGFRVALPPRESVESGLLGKHRSLVRLESQADNPVSRSDSFDGGVRARKSLSLCWLANAALFSIDLSCILYVSKLLRVARLKELKVQLQELSTPM